MRTLGVVQLGAATPKLLKNAQFIIHGILGTVGAFMRMKRSIRAALVFTTAGRRRRPLFGSAPRLYFPMAAD